MQNSAAADEAVSQQEKLIDIQQKNGLSVLVAYDHKIIMLLKCISYVKIITKGHTSRLLIIVRRLLNDEDTPWLRQDHNQGSYIKKKFTVVPA